MEQDCCKICILGYQRLTKLIKSAVSLLTLPDTEITVADCNINDLAEVVRAQREAGCDIFIAGSGNAAEFRRISQMPLVELEFSALDYLSGLHKALMLGIHPAFIKHKYAPEIPTARFSPIIDKAVPVFSYEDSFELQQIIMRDDIDVVIGATYTVELAAALGKAGVLLSPSVDTIHSAIRLARRRVENQRYTTEQQRIINGIIALPNIGIIVADQAGKITIFNMAAQTLTGLNRRHVIGQLIAHVLPALSNLPPSPDANEYREGVRLLNGTMVRCRERALMQKGRTFSTIYYLDIDNRRRKATHRSPRATQDQCHDIIAVSSSMAACVREADRLAARSDNICIVGEAHTGRRFVAE